MISGKRIKRDTRYAREIETATDEEGNAIERLHNKQWDREEIRFSFWKKGQSIIPRPLDLPENQLLPLFQRAISVGVFTEGFLAGLRRAIDDHLEQKGN